MPNPFGKYGDIALKGLLSQAAPGIAQGFLVELLKSKKVDVNKVSKWVLENRSLWGELEPNEQDGLRRLAAKAGDLSWMDANWVINAIRRDLPSVASLFLGWTKARNWLERQVEDLKREATASAG
jgi:hypothetical protein